MPEIALRRRLLIVEDNPADVLFLKRVLRENGLTADIAVAPDGDKAIEYLENCADEQRPDLVIIDINLPRRDGIDVLRKCRLTPSLLETRTLVLTSSDESSDHNRAEMIGVNAYLRKPRNVGDFVEIVATIRKLLDPLPV
jgi:two-component system, chemotaxis family, response regulator Rcp1